MDSDLQIRGGIEDNLKIIFLFFNKNIFCDPLQCSAQAAFCATVTQILHMTQPKMFPWDIWHTLTFGLSLDYQSVSFVGNSYAKNNFFCQWNSRSCNSCFAWCIGFLNCTGTSIQ